jgi:uncharacterized membrane protein
MMQPRPAPQVKWGEWINEGWQLFANRWQVWVPMMLVFFIVLVVPILPVYVLLFSLSLANPNDPEAVASPLIPLLGLGGGLITFGLAAFMLGGIYRTAFKQIRGEPISLRDLFSGGDLVFSMLGALLLIALCVNIGTVFCIVPGFLAMGLLFFTLPLIAERRLGVIDAMKLSFETTRPNMWMFMLFAFVVGLLAGLGAVACYVGLLVTYPLHFLITAAAYKDVFGVAGARSTPAVAAPPAYPPQAYNQQSWANQPPQSYAPPPPPAQPPRQYAPPPPAAAPQAPPQPSESATRTCPHCQAVLPRAANFCNFCGKSLRE